MKALCFDGESVVLETDRDVPHVPEDFALVRMTHAGICNTDLEITRGYMGFTGVLGHEFVGVIESGPAHLTGKRAVAEINFACGVCAMCERRLGRHCPNRTVMGILGQDGAFAERVAVPVRNLHVVPDGVPDRSAVFTEPLAAAFEILEQIPNVENLETVLLGDGKLGLLIAMVLHRAGAKVLLVGKHPAHLDIAGACGIATTHLDAWDRTPRDLVVDATGSATGFAMAVAATRPRGTFVLKSTVADDTPASLAPLVINEVTVVGSRCGPFGPALAALADGTVDPRDMIVEDFALDEGVAAFEKAGTRGTLKVLLRA